MLDVVDRLCSLKHYLLRVALALPLALYELCSISLLYGKLFSFPTFI